MIYSNRAHGDCGELLTTPATIFGSLIADLHRARHSIDMEYYIFASDRTGNAIADILCRKARQGVTVRLLVDGYGSRGITRTLLRRMLSAGVIIHRHKLLRNSRNHRKMTIVDRRIAHVGGVNIADRYAVGNNLGLWYDVQLRFTGRGVASLVELFDYDYMVAVGLRAVPPCTCSSRMLQLLWSEAHGGRAMSELLEDVVTSSRRSITLTTPYFMPPRYVVDLLASAVARGVRVSVIVPERCDVWVLDNITRGYVAMAQKRGVEMLIVRDAFVHAKMALVDGCRTILGSANLDARSLNINRELMLSTRHKGICRAAENFLLGLRQKCSLPRRSDLQSAFPSLMTKLIETVL